MPRRKQAIADGREVRADIVVSNADPSVIWGRLVPPEHVGWRAERRELSSTETIPGLFFNATTPKDPSRT